MMNMNTAIAVVGPTQKVPADIARLAKHLHEVDAFAFDQLDNLADLRADIVVVDVESVEKDDLALVSARIRRLKKPEQPIILISARSQLARLSAVELLQGNNAVSRPLASDNFTDLIDSLITLQRSRAGRPQTPDVSAAIAQARAIAEMIKEANPSRADTTLEAVQTLSSVLDRVFSISTAAGSITQQELGQATDYVSNAIARHGLGSWVETVRSHHSGTYQHCLLVAGTTVAFGRHFGFSSRDMRRVTAAALVHDVGKVAVPTEVLDKPSSLTPMEFELIKTHTLIGHDMISKVEGFDAEMSDMVLSHHEYLDGSGYPNGLMASQISDLVRVITIADVYAALVEKRSYKPPMTGRQAYEIMAGMTGKLDMPLVKAQQQIMAAA